MVVELRSLNQKKLKQEKIMSEYETQVAFYQRYNYGATAEMRKESTQNHLLFKSD